MYCPDKWVVIKISSDDKSHYRVLGSWFGGYAGSDSWRMNSGITSASLEDKFYKFTGSSGSVYMCHKDTYGMSSYTHSVLDDFKTKVQIELLPETTNFLSINYGN
jgi:hypothetical protein